jgi:hypothetical protein
MYQEVMRKALNNTSSFLQMGLGSSSNESIVDVLIDRMHMPQTTTSFDHNDSFFHACHMSPEQATNLNNRDYLSPVAHA